MVIATEVPLRIVHYVPGIRLAEGGVVRAILDWCTVLSQRGHEMSLVVNNLCDMPQEWLDHAPGKPRAYLVPQPKPPLKLLNKSAMETIEEVLRNADVLHLHGPWLDGNRQISKLARRLGVPYMVSLHGMLNDWSMSQRSLKKRIYLSLLGRRVLNNAAKIHYTAEAERSQSSKWFDNLNGVVMPHLMDMEPFEQLPGPEQGMELIPEAMRSRKKLLFLSRLHEKKGVDILIRASALLRDAGVSFVTLLAGTGDAGYERYLRDLVAELNLGDRVVFLGFVSGVKKISLYQVADLFVLPTHQENFGLVLTEAMACGTPVLTTKGTDIWEEIEGAGVVIADPSPQAFADEIGRILNDPADRGSRGRSWVMENLAMEPLSRKYEALYRELSTRRREVPQNRSTPD